MLPWNSCRQKLDVLSSIQGLRKLVKADSVCICLLQNIITQRFPGFRFLCFTSCCFPSIFVIYRYHVYKVYAMKNG